MIWCIYGEIGAGKTIMAVANAIRYINKGWYVFANFPIRYCYVISYQAFLKYKFPKKSLIVIDEAQMWFNSRNWQKLTMDALIKFTQSRKFGYDIIYTTQRPESVDIQLREITTYFCRLESWYIFSLIKYHSRPNFNDNEKRKYNLGISIFFPKLMNKYFSYYDTYSVVRPDWEFPVMSYLDYFVYYYQKFDHDYKYNFGGELIEDLKRPIELKKELRAQRKNFIFSRALIKN